MGSWKAGILDPSLTIGSFYNCWIQCAYSRIFVKMIECANIRNGETILEVACGTGFLFRKILAVNDVGRNIAADLSWAMLLCTQHHLRSCGAKHLLLRADARRLSFQSGVFDLVVNSFMFGGIPDNDIVPICSEFYRVLKPGGRIIIATLGFGERWYEKLWPRLRLMSVVWLKWQWQPISMRRYLADANFCDIAIEKIAQFFFPFEIAVAQKPYEKYDSSRNIHDAAYK